MRILKQSGVKLRRTVRIGLWTGEEQGLIGSRDYVKAHFGRRRAADAAVAPGRRPSGRADACGRGTRRRSSSGGRERSAGRGRRRRRGGPAARRLPAPGYLHAGTREVRRLLQHRQRHRRDPRRLPQRNDAVGPIFREWMEPFRSIGMTTLTIRNTGGTDHQSFDAVGLPGFQFIQDEVEYDTMTHHTNLDSYERLQPDDMRSNATIAAAFAFLAANRDEKLPRKPPTSAAIGGRGRGGN